MRRLTSYIKTQPNLELEKDGKRVFIKISQSITQNEIAELLHALWKYNFEIAFRDLVYPAGSSDPGAYFSYSNRKSIGQSHWSMTYGNHGWSGGIYHLRMQTVGQQIFNLISLGKLKKIQITDVNFFSHYEVKSAEKSAEKDAEIWEMHQ